jgi:hypothetical protein
MAVGVAMVDVAIAHGRIEVFIAEAMILRPGRTAEGAQEQKGDQQKRFHISFLSTLRMLRTAMAGSGQGLFDRDAAGDGPDHLTDLDPSLFSC